MITAVSAMATTSSTRVKPSRWTLVRRNRTGESIPVLLSTDHPQNSHANVIRLHVLVQTVSRSRQDLCQDPVAPVRQARFFAPRVRSAMVVDMAACQDIRAPHCGQLLATALFSVVAPRRERADGGWPGEAAVEGEPHDVRVSRHRILVTTPGPRDRDIRVRLQGIIFTGWNRRRVSQRDVSLQRGEGVREAAIG